MKRFLACLVATIFVLGLGATVVWAQNRKRSVSLGEVARRLRAQREKAVPGSKVFTNDDLVAQTKPDEPAAPMPATSSGASLTKAVPVENSLSGTSKVQAVTGPTQATPAKAIGEAQGGNSHRDPMSKVQIRQERKLQAARISPSAVRPAKHPAAPAVHARLSKTRQGSATTPVLQSAGLNPRLVPKVASRAGDPRQFAAVPKSRAKENPRSVPKAAERAAAPRQAIPASSSAELAAAIHQVATVPSPPRIPPRQDLGYVEKADGQVQAIVVDHGYVRLVQESKSFAKNFHPARPPSAEVEAAPAPPQPASPPVTQGPASNLVIEGFSNQDDGTPSPAVVEAASAPAPQAVPPSGNNEEPGSAASAALQPDALADYAGVQRLAKPPESFQAPAPPALPALPAEDVANRTSVQPLGYVEKAGGEREAIVEVLGQIYLVHEGELFADKYRALRVTATSVDIVEEPATAALPERRRKIKDVPPPVSR